MVDKSKLDIIIQLHSLISFAHFFDSNFGLVFSENIVYVTFNAGKTWDLGKYNFPVSFDSKIFNVDKNSKIQLCNGEDMFESNDFGLSWINKSQSYFTEMTQIGIDTFMGFTFLNGYSDYSTLYKTYTNGLSWEKIKIPFDIPNWYNNNVLISSQRNLILQFMKFNQEKYISKDYAKTWTPLFYFDDYFNIIEMKDTITGYCLYRTHPAKTVDGGISWKDFFPISPLPEQYNNITCYDTSHCAITFNKNSIYFTDNGGGGPYSGIPVIDSKSENPNLNIYPNPIESEGTINIDLIPHHSKDLKIKLINYKGQIESIDYTIQSSTLKISTKNISSGIYFIWIKDDLIQYKSKIIIQ